MEKQRCQWSLMGGNSLMIHYHDTEWGVPLHDDRMWFEYIVLDGMQAGLSWLTVLKKRENFRAAFDNFQPEIVANYTEVDFDRLMSDAGIVRNKLKIRAAINNAGRFLEVGKEFGSFDNYVWQFTNGKTLVSNFATMKEILPHTKESDAMSKDLLKHGLKFVGSTICYAFMQAAGMVNDHTTDCFRFYEVGNMSR